MLDFLKKIFRNRNRDLTIVLLDDQEPEVTNTFSFKPSDLFNLYYISILITVIVLLLLVMFTPLGTLVYDEEDEKLRASVIEVSKKVEALKDSLQARDLQLQEIQDVLSEGQDTLFKTNQLISGTIKDEVSNQNGEPDAVSEVQTFDMISKNEIIFSGILNESPNFPAPFPVEGTLTREFNLGNGHLGIDIATKDEKIFRAIADGSVINRDWTISYGYVLQIQHSDGIISIYKHASDLSKEVGDVILKGDILGTVGNTGVFSSGPHLHLEIWRNGIPQNPIMYLIN